uniref:Uncharacterized protein n=1 Tax=Anguilla anguilla TaxID=7936 RepID=A0A0E9WB20_ANGAN
MSFVFDSFSENCFFFFSLCDVGSFFKSACEHTKECTPQCCPLKETSLLDHILYGQPLFSILLLYAT